MASMNFNKKDEHCGKFYSSLILAIMMRFFFKI